MCVKKYSLPKAHSEDRQSHALLLFLLDHLRGWGGGKKGVGICSIW